MTSTWPLSTRPPDVDELADLIRQESFLHTDYGGMYPHHPRARLRCHPLAAHRLTQVFIPDGLLDFSKAADEDMSKILGIVVTVDATMEPGSWQLIAGEGTI